MVRNFIIFLLSIFLSIVSIKMSIRLSLLLATILLGSRIQGQRKLEYIRFKNSLIIEFFSILRISLLKSPVATVTLLLLHNFVSVFFFLVLVKTSYETSLLDVCSILLLKYQDFFHLEVQSNFIETHYLHQNKLFQNLFQA